MVIKKQGYPEINELVVCTVKKVLPHSVFAELDEYNREGMIHISEIAPGRIRNMRDHVTEGRKIVCKILSLSEEKGHINLSLRRVNQTQRIKKMQDYKQEIRATRLLEKFAEEERQKESVESLAQKIFKKYETLTESFYDIINKKLNLADLGIEKKIADKLTKVIKEKIKSPEVKIKTDLVLQCFQPDGVVKIKIILEKLMKNHKNTTCLYMGAPKYRIEITSKDYREAEAELKNINQEAEQLAKEYNCTARFERQSK